jgi:hypothetical protein
MKLKTVNHKSVLLLVVVISLTGAIAPVVPHLGSNVAQAQENPENFYAYAPYWYVDGLTDSFIEVKNHLREELIVAPILRLTTGQSLKLPSIAIAPLMTKRMRLKDHLHFKSQGGKRIGRWGDGSRPNSLVGSAQLSLVSPKSVSAKAFSAWIIVEDLQEKLVFVASPFENPADAISNVLEGLWWVPYPDTQVYFALQNTSRIPVTLRVELFNDRKAIRTLILRLKASSMNLINIVNLLQPDTLPAMGGIRFTYESKGDHILPGRILGRGILIQEKKGFSSPLVLYGSLGHVPTNTSHELHAPAAYFGKLDRLLARTEGSSHPHLLMRNITEQNITAQVRIYGRDASGKPAELYLQAVAIEPHALIHIDLEEQRQQLQSPIADGVAGLRVIHNGGPTDIIAELINVDDTGHTVLYDRIRNLFLHKASMQVAISFSFEWDHQARDRQTFLILKNVTDEPQEARILLHYDQGRRQYDVRLPKIDAQQVEIVDIKLLRDNQIKDKNGQTLPSDVQFGGAVIFSEPGAFAISDPTFILGPEKSPRGSVGSFSCINDHGIPICDGAQSDLGNLGFQLRLLNEELRKPTPDPGRVRILKDLVIVWVDQIISNLNAYIASGCCEPHLDVLQSQVSALPWPGDQEVQGARSRLINAIQAAKVRARGDHEHC